MGNNQSSAFNIFFSGEISLLIVIKIFGQRIECVVEECNGSHFLEAMYNVMLKR